MTALIVSASAIAQTNTPINKFKAKMAPTARDTVFNFTLTQSQTQALLNCMTTTLNLLPRSADLTALHASEAQKQVYTIGKIITDQLPKSVAPKDSIAKK